MSNSTSTVSAFAKAMNASAITWNGATSYASPDVSGEHEGRVSLFFKGCRGLNVPRLYEYLSSASRESVLDTFLLAFQLRDTRGGKGERLLGREALKWLFVHYPVQFKAVIHLLPEYGRWDDLLLFFPKVINLDLENLKMTYSVSDKVDIPLLKEIQTYVVSLFATQLKKDRSAMLNGAPISLCAKWTPTEGDARDRAFGVFTTLADAMKSSKKELRKMYNTPLRAYLKIVERFMCSGEWSNVDYNSVPSCAMKRLKKAFKKRDGKRFEEWSSLLEQKDPNIAKVNAKQLYPHEIIGELRTKNMLDSVLTAQWNVLVEEARKLGALRDIIPVVDVSGSMFSPKCLPLDVATSLGLLISEVVQGTFHRHLLTFHSNPSFFVVPNADLLTQYKKVIGMEWGGSTNLEKTFLLILNRAKECNLTQNDMPKKLIIISDMQFNSATGGGTNFEKMNKLYASSGYVRPQIVFWNVVGASTDFPVTVDDKGTAMISGFSPSILKSLMSGSEYSVVGILRETLDDKRYDAIRNCF